METGGEEHAEIYDEQHDCEPVPDSPERTDILEQSTQLVDHSSMSQNLQSTLPGVLNPHDYDQNMDDPNLEDFFLRPSSIQTNEYDRDEGDTMYDGDPDEELREEDDGIQEDDQDQQYVYTADDTVPNTVQTEEEEDIGTLPPGGDEEELWENWKKQQEDQVQVNQPNH